MAEKLIRDDGSDDVLSGRHVNVNVVFDVGEVLRRLPGRDVEISDDEGDFDVDATSKPIEIVEEKPVRPPRKPSLLLNAPLKVTSTSTRKRSVTFESIDVAGIKPPSPKQIEAGGDLADEVTPALTWLICSWEVAGS